MTGGNCIELDESSVVGFNTRTYLRLRAGGLGQRVCNDRFEAVELRSDRDVKVGEIVWMSYDPRDHKGGVQFPRSSR